VLVVRCTSEECVDGEMYIRRVCWCKMYINTDTAYSRKGLTKAHKHVSRN